MRIRKLTVSVIFFLVSLLITITSVKAAGEEDTGAGTIRMEQAISSDQRLYRETR